MFRKHASVCLLLIIAMMFPSPVSFAATVSISFPASDREIVNPFIGNAAWASDTSERPQPFTLVYAPIIWAKIEPEEGVFNFESFEKEHHFDKWREEGKRVILRFILDLPGNKKHRDIPDWLWKKTGKDGKAYNVSYGQGYSPDYENPTLIEAHAKAIKAIGERYGQDPFIAYVQLGSLGHWGEWHVHSQAGTLPLTFIRDMDVEPYFEAFPAAKLMMRRPFAIAAERNMGLFNDSSGDPDSTESWLDWIENGGRYSQTNEKNAMVPMPDAWLNAPVGGELSTNYDETDFLDDKMLDQTLLLFKRSHTSWIGPGSFVWVDRDSEYQKALDQVNSIIGYRLRVAGTEFTQNGDGSVSLSLTWANSGIAPFYFDWIPSLMIAGSDGSRTIVSLDMKIRDVVPEMPVRVDLRVDSTLLPAEEYAFYAGIIDPMTGEAEIELAMDTPREGDWFRLFSIRNSAEN